MKHDHHSDSLFCSVVKKYSNLSWELTFVDTLVCFLLLVVQMHENNENLKNTTEPYAGTQTSLMSNKIPEEINEHCPSRFTLLKCLHAMVSTFYIAAVNKLGVPIVIPIVCPNSGHTRSLSRLTPTQVALD